IKTGLDAAGMSQADFEAALKQHLARLGRKSLSFSKSVELHDKVIGHYLNIKHYQ
ncbi:IS1 family transposase, partial [Escherichia coli]